MKQVKVAGKQLLVGRKKIPLLSGEVHYWRLEPEKWEMILDRVKEMGLEVIATYVPWFFHEYTRGKFDFTGQTSGHRNLDKFLKLAKVKGLWVIIRPGPYINAECTNEGLPEYIAKYYSLHPKFLESAGIYLEEVCRIIVPHQATHDGTIILCQADNEIYPQAHNYRNQLGLGKERGIFQDFAKEKYQTIKKLNMVWNTNYETFDEVTAVTANILNDVGFIRRYLDYKEFNFWYAKRYCHWVKQKFIECGIDVPIYTNSPSLYGMFNWPDLQETVDMHGIDIYCTNELDDDYDNIENFFDKTKYVYTYANIPYIAEFQSGVIADFFPGLTENHYRLLCFSAFANGITGWNWYMLVERESCFETPILARGLVRTRLFNTFKNIVTIFKRLNPPELVRLTETSVTFDYMHRCVREKENFDSTWEAVFHSGIDFVYYDLNRGRIRKKILFYSGYEWLNKRSQKELIEYVENGGILIVFQNYPRLDEKFDNCNLLNIIMPARVSMCGDVSLTGLNVKDVEIKIGNAKIDVPMPVFEYKVSHGKSVLGRIKISERLISEIDSYRANIDRGEELTIGYLEERGKGRLMVLGVVPTPQLIVELHNYFKVPIYARSITEDVYVSLYQMANKYYLIGINNSRTDKFAKVLLDDNLFMPYIYQIRDLESEKCWKVSLKDERAIYFQINKKNGVVLEIKKDARCLIE